ncbi:DNA alkylation repair protein [Paeniglutamicibacter gangotriensis Lz1y]|uniref:DNA alkylation repair protein n=1 Tax=Paeniglutamicibacter gangotriensis Lz1y TaxID=1276920 RepID=M7MR19_9MICC|nr:DNA alkylation repair protein [Paeniglutamicibacter gangotriensis Lz1y]
MPFADQLINESTVLDLIGSLVAVVPDAGLPTLHLAAPVIETLGLRERADLLCDALLSDLPGDYAALAGTIRAASEDEAFRGWLIWPVTSAIAVKAVAEGTTAAFDDAVALLAELTGRLTAEFAIRTLLRHDLDRALELIRDWTTSEDLDVRRLASEGTRPYLPWSTRVPEITARTGVTIPVLNALYRDPEEYVRRSVANHLNDLSRDAPAMVVDTARRWLAEPDENTARLVRHALRTLVKKGDVQALELLGFGPVSVVSQARCSVAPPSSLAAASSSARCCITAVTSPPAWPSTTRSITARPMAGRRERPSNWPPAPLNGTKNSRSDANTPSGRSPPGVITRACTRSACRSTAWNRRGRSLNC